jgi:D-beta-D-heptose 7-phosphate kinase/D-beta-D-heptose 1-phosphate adenosyltransferase
MKFVITSGYFNPIRPAHIEYLSLAKQLGDRLIVIVNNDQQVKLKREVPFMNESDRRMIVQSLKCVDGVVASTDTDKSVCKSIRDIYNYYNSIGYKLNTDSTNSMIFAKGGDRFAEEIPESSVCKELGIKIVDSLGDKHGSSGELLDDYFNHRASSLLLEPLKQPTIYYCICDNPLIMSHTSKCQKCYKYIPKR